MLAYPTHLDLGLEGRVGAASSAATALAEMGALRAIPSPIELLLRDSTGRLNYEVGYFGLAQLAGVTWQESYDGAWWLGWWEKNRQRFPPDVAALTIRR